VEDGRDWAELTSSGYLWSVTIERDQIKYRNLSRKKDMEIYGFG